MATLRMKRSGVGGRGNKMLKCVHAEEEVNLRQPKVTEFFSTIHRTSTSGVKRRKLQLSTEAETDVAIANTEKSIGNYGSAASFAEDQLEGCDKHDSICSEKGDADLATPESAHISPLLSVSPRIRKIVEPHETTIPRCKAIRSLLFTDSKIEKKDGTVAVFAELPIKAHEDKNVAVKAMELADIIKHNVEFRNAIKKSVKNGDDLHCHLKTIASPKDTKLQQQNARPEQATVFKNVCTSLNKKAFAERPSTSTSVPEYVLPLSKPKTPSKWQTPSKLRTPTKSLYETEDDANELRSPLKYGRAALLVSEVKNCASLPLPMKYERLYKLYGHMERVMAILYLQDRRITLDEVSRNVQKNIKCDFTIHHFAQILSVYPKAFIVRLEEHWAPMGGVRSSETRFDYVIEPNLQDDIMGYMREEDKYWSEAVHAPIPLSPVKSPRAGWRRSPYKKTPIKLQSSVAAANTRPKMEAWRTTVRAYIFKYRLHEFVKQQHKEFLEKIGIKMEAKELGNLRRYHPDFKLDEVQDIPEAKLPVPPKDDAALNRTMRDYMRTVEDSSSTLPQRIKDIIDELRSPEKHAALAAGAKAALASSEGSSDAKKPKGLSLLERIRAKEQAKRRAEMMRDPAAEIRKGRLEKLSRSTLRNICGYYAFKKATTMELSEMISKLVFSDSNCSKLEMEAQIELLCEVAPEYFKMKSIKGIRYVQMQRNDFDAVHNIVTRIMTVDGSETTGGRQPLEEQ